MRFALLFSGMSFRRHVNGLEFCYRTLVERLGVPAGNIQVLNYDGSLRAFGEDAPEPDRLWPGDATPYRMKVTAEGSREQFRCSMRHIGSSLGRDDQLFINTTGHGGHHGTDAGPDLLAFPNGRRLSRDEFCESISELPRHRAMIVLMSQCFGGGFAQAVLEASPASSTVVVSASRERRSSFMSFESNDWDSFQRNWLAAFGGRDVDGSPSTTQRSAGTSDQCACTSVADAFQLASSGARANPYDSPQLNAFPSSAGSLCFRD